MSHEPSQGAVAPEQLCALDAGGDVRELRERPVLFPSAAASVHAATLTRDDVIDGSELRDGRLASGPPPTAQTTRRWRTRGAPGILPERSRRRRSTPRSVCGPTMCLPATDEY